MATRVDTGGTIEICFWVVGEEILVSVSDQAMLDYRVPPEVRPDGGMDSESPSFSILRAVFERYGGRIWQDGHTHDYRFTLPFLDIDQADRLGITFKQSNLNTEPEIKAPGQLIEE